MAKTSGSTCQLTDKGKISENGNTIASKQSKAPMTHVSTDVLKEFMMSDNNDVNGEELLKNGDEGKLSDFDLDDLVPSVVVSEVVSGSSLLKECNGDVLDVPTTSSCNATHNKENSGTTGSSKLNSHSKESVPSDAIVNIHSKMSKKIFNEKQTMDDKDSANSDSTKHLVSNSSSNNVKNLLTNTKPTAKNKVTGGVTTSKKILDKNDHCNIDKETDITSNSKKVVDTEKLKSDKKSSKKIDDSKSFSSLLNDFDNDDKEELLVGSTLTDESMHLLEESLLNDDDCDDHELDEIGEENLLKGSDEVNCDVSGELTNSSKPEGGGKLALDKYAGKKMKDNGSASKHLRESTLATNSESIKQNSTNNLPNKEIVEKEQSNTNLSFLEEYMSGCIQDATKDKKGIKRKISTEGRCAGNSEANSNQSSTEEKSNIKSSGANSRKSSRSNSLDGRKSTSNMSDSSFKANATDNTSKPQSRESIDNTSTNQNTSTSKVTKGKNNQKSILFGNTSITSSLTFSEALKSLEVDNDLAMERPTTAVPATDVCPSDIPASSLTVLQTPTSKSDCKYQDGSSNAAVQGTKRSLSTDSDGQNNSGRQDLKKIRITREDRRTGNSNTASDLVEITKRLEKTSQMESRLEAEKAGQKSLHQESSKLSNDTNNDPIIVIDQAELEQRTMEEIQKSQVGSKNLKKIKRKDLENLVIELFMDKVLYEHQLGQQKDLCKRLETTLEANRKKAVQFHKEIEDLKKVTQRLVDEHQSRKSQLVTPVKVKRSVGIQANPSIIAKGVMHTSASSTTKSNNNNANKNMISQRMGNPKTNRLPLQVGTHSVDNRNVLRNPIPTSSVAKDALKIVGVNGKDKAQSKQIAPITVARTLSTKTSSNSQVVLLDQSPLVVQQSTQLSKGVSSGNSVSSILQSTLINGAQANKKKDTASNVIDLTDDDEVSRTKSSSGTNIVAIQRTVNNASNTTGQLVAINGPSNQVSQLLLVPTSIGQSPTTLVVGGINPTANQNITTSLTPIRANPSIPTQSLRLAAPGTVVKTTRVLVPSQTSQLNRHPAPLPKAPPQQTGGYSKKLPPSPILKLSHKDNSIVLSWNMMRTFEHEKIASYQLYAYQEGSSSPSSSLWKKVGSVKALELPMACTLTQFMPGHIYHFAVRAVDIRTRLGPFSLPKSIRLVRT